jgi:hypothetical protein
MSLVLVRKTQLSIEEIVRERGGDVTPALRVGTALAVVANPYAGRFEPQLLAFMEALRPLARQLAGRLVDALGGPDQVEAYGKGAIVGEDGELEHGAVWHDGGGWGMRDALGGRKAIVPSAKTMGNMGTRLMVPLGHTRAAFVRSHYNVAEMTVWDGPRRDEIVFGLVMATGGRIDARVGGLAVSDVQGLDGSR